MDFIPAAFCILGRYGLQTKLVKQPSCLGHITPTFVQSNTTQGKVSQTKDVQKQASVITPPNTQNSTPNSKLSITCIT